MQSQLQYLGGPYWSQRSSWGGGILLWDLFLTLCCLQEGEKMGEEHKYTEELRILQKEKNYSCSLDTIKLRGLEKCLCSPIWKWNRP